MKKSLFFLSLFAVACSGDPENTVPEIKTDTTSTSTVPEITETNGFEKDWRNFKIAVLDKDGPAAAYFIRTDAIDAEGLIALFEDEFYARKLEETDYGDLAPSEWEGKPVKEFRADQDYTDEDGNSFESAIFLYFEEQDQGLKLINVLMAG